MIRAMDEEIGARKGGTLILAGNLLVLCTLGTQVKNI